MSTLTWFFPDFQPGRVRWGSIWQGCPPKHSLSQQKYTSYIDDVMYETMAVYKMSWAFYISFIFFTAFAFLNMIIGIVVNVIEEEHQRERHAQAEASGDPTLRDLQNQIAELKQMIERK